MTLLHEGSIPRRLEPQESFSRERLSALATDVNLRFVQAILKTDKTGKNPSLRDMVLNRVGTRSVGDVENRPDDDEIEIDRVGEDALRKIIEANSLPVRVFSEHSYFGPQRGFVLRAAQDPLDNSSQFKRNLPTSVYSCLSEYDLQGNPIGSVIVDIREAKAYISMDGKNCVIDNVLQGTSPRAIYKSERKSISDPDITIASYTGSPEYGLKFYAELDQIPKTMDRKGRMYADGGAFIYGLLAEGVVDAYVMRNEPISEIAPGAAMAQAAGCVLWCVDEKGRITDYKFDQSKFRKDVFLFIAAGTQELATEIYNCYFSDEDQPLAA